MSDLEAYAAGVLIETEDVLTVHFGYDHARPVELQMTLFRSNAAGCCQTCGEAEVVEAISYVFARELLDKALCKPGITFGEGDVTFESIQDLLSVYLVDDNGDYHPMIMEAAPVRDFMIRTYMLVPTSLETVDVDGAIAQLLGGEPC